MIRTRWPAITLACTLAAAIGALASATGARADAQQSPAGSTTGTGAVAGTSCPSSNPPNELVLVAGTPQTARLETAFAGGLEVQLANTDGCAITTALTGTPVTFTAPASGASATFAASGARTLTVGADAAGSAVAHMLTANDSAGSYAVTASCADGTVSFALRNTAAGIPAMVTPLAPTSEHATVERRYAQPLAVRVLDADGNPVSGATVVFTLVSASVSGAGGGATFIGGSGQATATTNADGIATSPRFTAGDRSGAFTATARAAGATAVALFHLRNRAGAPFTVAAGVGAAQSTPTGTRFAIPLAVTITDAHGNPVPDVAVRFAAPSSGPSGTFAAHAADPTATVATDGQGIAVAPAFTANTHAGGYIVIATVNGIHPVAFALVNDDG